MNDAQQAILNMIPGHLDGFGDPVANPHFKEMYRKLRTYSYSTVELEFFKKEIETWNQAQTDKKVEF